MLRYPIRICCLFLLTSVLFLPLTALAHTAGTIQSPASPASMPEVDPSYVYNQLFYLGSHFLRREAGYDTNLSATVNGHDEFAAYWSQEMTRDLQGFGPQVERDPFAVKGWTNRPAVVPAFNEEVSIPGITHPEQVVVIGCHYDGEAISTQSAFDDASGCAIELGIARAMGAYWRAQHVYPARTLRFVAFDAEEQGLYGSFHYVNSAIDGDLPNIVAMFNEEQNGIAYPLRYLGELSHSQLPFFIEMSPAQNNSSYSTLNQLSSQQRDATIHFKALMQAAVPAVFAQFRALGYQKLTYHTNNDTQNVAQPIFTTDQLSAIHVEDDQGIGSDQIPFTMAGIPCATFIGDGVRNDNPAVMPPYPFDTAVDTVQLMNTYADGSSQKSQALALALALPAMLNAWMLVQPDVLGQAAFDGNPLAAIGDIGQAQPGKSIALDSTAFLPGNSNAALKYSWDFGDGSGATGMAVNHTYRTAGKYTLMLMVTSSTGKRILSKTINVTDQLPNFPNPFLGFHATGNTYQPADMPAPRDRLTDQVGPRALFIVASPEKTSSRRLSTPSASFPISVLAGGTGAVLALLIVVILLFMMRRKRHAT